MSTILSLPKLEMSMTEATLVEWLAEDGAEITVGQPLYAIETDKATQEIDSTVSGTLTRLVEADQTYPVGSAIARID